MPFTDVLFLSIRPSGMYLSLSVLSLVNQKGYKATAKLCKMTILTSTDTSLVAALFRQSTVCALVVTGEYNCNCLTSLSPDKRFFSDF